MALTFVPTQTSANEGVAGETTAASVNVVDDVTSTVVTSRELIASTGNGVMPASVKLPVSPVLPQVPGAELAAPPSTVTEATIP